MKTIDAQTKAAVQAEVEKLFGEFGGQYAPEILKENLDELEATYLEARKDPDFIREFQFLQKQFIGRPSILYYSQRLTDAWGGPKIYLKREDLNHTGAHKINNTVGQVLLARRMGKTRIIAETGAGQHGVATATVCAHFGLECVVFMGAEDVRRQKLNAYKMELMGTKIVPVTSGQGTLKDATSEAMRDWSLNVRDTHYIIGSVVGPHPFPLIVTDFQRMIGDEARSQIQEAEGQLPNLVAACVGGGSNSAGMFAAFLDDQNVELLGLEAAGHGVDVEGEHAASISKGQVGVFHSFKSYVIQDQYGQIAPVHSISAGLDYPGVGPIHAHLFKSGRGTYRAVTDEEAVNAFEELSKLEGIIPALESSHALAGVKKYIEEKGWRGAAGQDKIIVVSLSGRGDKDVAEVARYRGKEIE